MARLQRPPSGRQRRCRDDPRAFRPPPGAEVPFLETDDQHPRFAVSENPARNGNVVALRPSRNRPSAAFGLLLLIAGRATGLVQLALSNKRSQSRLVRLGPPTVEQHRERPIGPREDKADVRGRSRAELESLLGHPSREVESPILRPADLQRCSRRPPRPRSSLAPRLSSSQLAAVPTGACRRFGGEDVSVIFGEQGQVGGQDLPGGRQGSARLRGRSLPGRRPLVAKDREQTT
jgi:hypothetical protein